MPKTQYTIRLEDDLLARVKQVASAELRSLNNQIEYFIAKGVEAYELDERLGALSYEETDD